MACAYEPIKQVPVEELVKLITLMDKHVLGATELHLNPSCVSYLPHEYFYFGNWVGYLFLNTRRMQNMKVQRDENN